MSTRSFVLFTDPFTGRESLLGDDGMHLTNVHPQGQCAGSVCVLHNPTDHHMREWPMKWFQPMKIFVRVCDHGIWHTDPDQYEYLAQRGDAVHHMCDGCCHD